MTPCKSSGKQISHKNEQQKNVKVPSHTVILRKNETEEQNNIPTDRQTLSTDQNYTISKQAKRH